MSTDWRDDPEWRAFASDTGLPVPTRGEKLAVEAYKRTLKTRIEEMGEPENRGTWDDGSRKIDSYAVKANQTLAAVLAVLEEQ